MAVAKTLLRRTRRTYRVGVPPIVLLLLPERLVLRDGLLVGRVGMLGQQVLELSELELEVRFGVTVQEVEETTLTLPPPGESSGKRARFAGFIGGPWARSDVSSAAGAEPEFWRFGSGAAAS